MNKNNKETYLNSFINGCIGGAFIALILLAFMQGNKQGFDKCLQINTKAECIQFYGYDYK